MSVIVPAEGIILDQILEKTGAGHGLTPAALRKFNNALSQTSWGLPWRATTMGARGLGPSSRPSDRRTEADMARSRDERRRLNGTREIEFPIEHFSGRVAVSTASMVSKWK